MYNISFINFGVTDEPVEVDETWTKMMYICLFLGGFWCGAITFVMLLAIHTLAAATAQTRPSNGGTCGRSGWFPMGED